LDLVNEAARANLDQANRVVLANAIDKPGLTTPSQTDFEQIFAGVTSMEIEPYVDTTLDEPLVPEPPEPGSIVSESVIDELNMTVWTLSNGVTVWLKPTDFKEDEIAMQATSPGGWSNSSLEDHQSAAMAAGLVQQGGVRAFSAIDLQKALAGKAVQVSPFINQNTEGMSGSASPQDLETMLQLVWLYFTAPREDETAFQAFIAQGRAVLENLGSNPMAAFADTFSVTMAQGHPRSRPLSVAVLDEIDLKTGVDFYKERFADASDFTFVFVGAIDLDIMRPLVEQYLGSLPRIERVDSHVDLDIDPPDAHIQKTVRAGVEPQSQTIMAFSGPFDYTAQNRVGMRVMAQALEIRLRERMREDLGGTYGVGVTGGYEQIPEESYTVTVAFGSDPLRSEELRGVVFEELRKLQVEGPSQEDVDKVVEGERRTRETNVRLNPYWAAQLIGAKASGQDPRFLLDTTTIDAVTIESIQTDARRYLNEDRVVIVTLLPAEKIGRP
jgi:zinc protease